MRILVADSDPVFLKNAQRFLQQRGHDTRVAGDGLECADIMNAFTPDAVVLDQGLLWGGWEGIAAHIHESPRLSGAQLFLIADHGFSRPVEVGTTSASIECLRKPLCLSELLVRIEGRKLSFKSRSHGQISATHTTCLGAR